MKTILSAAEIRNLQENLKQRGGSFKKGMLLLFDFLKNIELKKNVNNKETSQLIEKYIGIIVCIDEFYEEYKLKLDVITSLDEGKQNLSDLLGKYKQLLQANASLKDPFESLCLAERCLVWKNGRKSFETIVKNSQFEVTGRAVKSSQLEIAQQEIPCHDPDLLAKEYKKIDDKTPPFWFKWLAPWQQDFIRANQATLLKNTIPSSLRSVPGLANLSKHVCSINGVESLSYFRHATPRPVDLMTNEDADDEEYRLTCLNMASQVRLSLEDQFKQADSKHIKKEAVILTQSLLSPGIVANGKSWLVSGPSDNDTEMYKMKEEIVELFQYALSHPNKTVDEKHVRLKVLFFSLNKAISYKDFLSLWGLEAENTGLFRFKGHEPLKITLLSTNHPLNILRRTGLYPQQTANNDCNTAVLLGTVGRFLTPIFEKYSANTYSIQQLPRINQLLKTLSNCEEHKKVSETDKRNLNEILDNLLGMRHKFDENTHLLFCALHMLLSTPSTKGSLTDKDVHHSQLMISSAEAIILNCIQGSLWVACKSGKDRTGIASIAYDAALVYYKQYKKLPAYKDEGQARQDYVSLIEGLFHSGHHQKVAGLSAPGAEGIVRPSWIFSNDTRLGEGSNETSTFFARLNKPLEPNRWKGMKPLPSKKPTKNAFFTLAEQLKAKIAGPKEQGHEIKFTS